MPKIASDHAKLPPFDLRAEREKRELTQEETAKLLYTTQSSIGRWEENGNMPPLERAYWALYWKQHKPPASTTKKAKPQKS